VGLYSKAPMIHPKDGLFHLLVLDASGECLLAEHIASRLLLPVVCPPPGQARVPVAVQTHLNKLGLRAIIGGVIKVRDSVEQFANDVVLWVATQGNAEHVSANLDWIPIEECTDIRMLLPFQRRIFRDRAFCRELLGEAQAIDREGDWVRSVAASQSRGLTGDFTQLRVGRQRRLSCFSTASGSPLYCLAGSAAAGEADLAHWLTLHRPNSFPEILAYDLTTSRCLVDTVVGTPLTECLTLENCKRAIAKLAELQISLLGRRRPNLAEPQRDFRLRSIASQIDRDFGKLLDALRAAGGDFRTRNDSVFSTLHAVFEEALTLSIPETFVHADAAPPNIFLHEDGMRLIDLETAGWGFPFITPETLLRSEEILQRPHWTEELRREYCRPWMTVISEKQLQRGMYLAPLIRVWARLRRLLHSSFESEPERYWHPALYRYLLVGYAQKLLRMTSSWL
jgi:hypothetical protein